MASRFLAASAIVTVTTAKSSRSPCCLVPAPTGVASRSASNTTCATPSLMRTATSLRPATQISTAMATSPVTPRLWAFLSTAIRSSTPSTTGSPLTATIPTPGWCTPVQTVRMTRRALALWARCAPIWSSVRIPVTTVATLMRWYQQTGQASSV